MSKNGFTLMELMFTIVIFGIITSIAIPGFQSLNSTFLKRKITRDIYGTVHSARIAAIGGNQRGFEKQKTSPNYAFTIRQIIVGEKIDYAVFRDQNKNAEYDSGEEIVSFKKIEAEGVSVKLRAGRLGVNDIDATSLTINSIGLVKNNSTTPMSTTWIIVKKDGEEIGKIKILISGVITIK